VTYERSILIELAGHISEFGCSQQKGGHRKLRYSGILLKIRGWISYITLPWSCSTTWGTPPAAWHEPPCLRAHP